MNHRIETKSDRSESDELQVDVNQVKIAKDNFDNFGLL